MKLREWARDNRLLDFGVLLRGAKPCREYEKEIVSQISAKWDKWGLDVFVTELEINTLLRIGGNNE